MLPTRDLCERKNKRVGTINLSEFSVSVEKTPRGFCYSSSSEKAEGSMSIIGSSAILNLNLPRLR